MTKLKVPITPQDHHRGSFDAPIQLLEYGDFQCPYCGQAFREIERYLKDFKNETLFVYRQFPLTNVHPYAGLSAIASEAADQQGQFWQMHHLLFQNQEALSEESIFYFARNLGLDMDRFQADLSREDLAERVQRDFMSGVRSGVNGTPTMFLNGYRFEAPVSYPNLRGAAQELLGRTTGGAWTSP